MLRKNRKYQFSLDSGTTNVGDTASTDVV